MHAYNVSSAESEADDGCLRSTWFKADAPLLLSRKNRGRFIANRRARRLPEKSVLDRGEEGFVAGGSVRDRLNLLRTKFNDLRAAAGPAEFVALSRTRVSLNTRETAREARPIFPEPSRQPRDAKKQYRSGEKSVALDDRLNRRQKDRGKIERER